MTTDLSLLVLFTLWGLVLIYLPSGGRLRAAGVAWGLGNRDSSPEFPAWIGRAQRAAANHAENWPLFATAVVVVHLAGRADDVSALACQTFFGARVAHAVFYVSGLIGLRTGAYYLSIAALLTVYSRLLL